MLLLSGIFVENCYKMLMSMSIWELLSIILAVLKQLKGGYVKALGAYHSIFKNFSNLDSVPVKVILLKLLSALVSLILLYCSVWGVHLLGRLTNIEMS